MKMKDHNSQLVNALGSIPTKERIISAASVTHEDTENIQGHESYSMSDKLRLVSMLNTLKIQPQFYRTENEQMTELRDLIEKIGMDNPYFVAQAIVYSRCMGEGMRFINHLAAALLAPFASGQPWAKAFYGSFNKHINGGGCIFRLDDMSEIKDIWAALNKKENGKMLALPNAMKKGFAQVLENTDANLLAKYKNTVIDIANLVHPNSSKSKATATINGEVVNVLNAIMKGITVQADTWESANSEAGREVAKAVKQGKITQDEGDKILAEAKADNWEALLEEGKLGVIAALRNIRNIMKNPRENIISMWCKLINDPNKVRKSLILPIHFDLAYEVVMNEFAQADYSPIVQAALLNGYKASIPNLANVFTGRTCVMVDCSGSMHMQVAIKGKAACKNNIWFISENDSNYHTTCIYKASLIAATIAKATNADIVRFGSTAKMFTPDMNQNVFALAKSIGSIDMGGTDLASAFYLITFLKKSYDRIIIISDNEINGRVTSSSYADYIRKVADPYVYSCDMAAYGTAAIGGGKVNYYVGYGPSLFEDIMAKEFNPNLHIEKVRKVVIDPAYVPTN